MESATRRRFAPQIVLTFVLNARKSGLKMPDLLEAVTVDVPMLEYINSVVSKAGISTTFGTNLLLVDLDEFLKSFPQIPYHLLTSDKPLQEGSQLVNRRLHTCTSAAAQPKPTATAVTPAVTSPTVAESALDQSADRATPSSEVDDQTAASGDNCKEGSNAAERDASTSAQAPEKSTAAATETPQQEDIASTNQTQARTSECTNSAETRAETAVPPQQTVPPSLLKSLLEDHDEIFPKTTTVNGEGTSAAGVSPSPAAPPLTNLEPQAQTSPASLQEQESTPTPPSKEQSSTQNAVPAEPAF